VQYDGPNATLSYWNAAGAFTVFATGITLSVSAFSPYFFNAAKMVVNPLTSVYRRFILGRAVYTATIQGAAPQVFANATTPRIDLFMQITSRVGQSDGVFVDDVFATYNELA
jgi:hypothetical protein